MNLFGEKIILRAMDRDDMEILRKWKNDPEIEFLQGESWSFPVGKDDQERWFEGSHKDPSTQRWMICLKGDNAPIGYCGLWFLDWKNRKAHPGIVIGEKGKRGKGLGVDIINTMSDFAFNELGLNRLYGWIAEYNQGSMKLMIEKCGWKKEGVLRKDFFRNGHFYDTVRVAILAEEFHRQFPERRRKR